MAKRRIATLDKRVTFQWSPTGVTDPSTGGNQADWKNIDSSPTVWAQVAAAPGGDEFDERGKLQPRMQWTVTIRRRTDLTTKHRVLYGARTLYVKAIGDVSSRSEFVDLLCTEYPS